MRDLLDACVPQDLRRHLTGLDVETAHFAGLAQMTNGLLLDAMTGRFDILVTVDARLRHRQNMTNRQISIVVLRASSNRLPDLVHLIPSLLSALATIAPGEIREITP